MSADIFAAVFRDLGHNYARLSRLSFFHRAISHQSRAREVAFTELSYTNGAFSPGMERGQGGPKVCLRIFLPLSIETSAETTPD